jgi:hypothetical protein
MAVMVFLPVLPEALLPELVVVVELVLVFTVGHRALVKLAVETQFLAEPLARELPILVVVVVVLVARAGPMLLAQVVLVWLFFATQVP